MKRTAFALALAVALGSGANLAAQASAADQASFKLTGDVDAQAVSSAQNSGSVFQGVSPFSEVTAGGLIDGKLAFSRRYTTLGLFDFTFQENNVLDHQTGAKIESLSLLVNELYADLNYGDLFYLRLGKQRLKWGAGFVYNPSDPVNPPKDPTALRAVREGVTALKLELITKPVSFMGFGVLYDALGQTGIGSRVSTPLIPNTDLAVSAYWSQSESWTVALNASVAPLYDIPGWDTLQLWFEGSIYDRTRYAPFSAGVGPYPRYSFLTGGMATLPEIRTVLLVEYYHLSEGLSADQIASVYQGLRAGSLTQWYTELALRPARLGSDYLYVSVTQPTLTDSGDLVFDKIGLLASCLFSLTDSSFFATGGITTTFVKDSEVDLTATWANGGNNTEFGNVLANVAVTLDVKVFF
ncbi:MAG TPA: hypothetical protein VMM82_14615 [Spirochaetia bacterium]|nr:hypothetical protein [Spirochaetia bacterium]